jgi:hypothetical protein
MFPCASKTGIGSFPRRSSRSEAAVREVFRDFYLAKGEQMLTNRVAHFSPLVGVKPRSIAVRELGYH